MLILTKLIFIFFIFYLLNILFVKNNIFLENPTKKHKKYLNNKNLPISGGILITLSIFFLTEFSLEIKVASILIFFIGLMSDLEFIESPSSRIFLQTVIILIYLFLSKSFITDIRIDFVNNIFEAYFITSILFTGFCFIVLVNGTNFMDGINTLTCGYYILILIILLPIINQEFYYIDLISNKIQLDVKNIYYFLGILTIFFTFNFFGKSILGDGGDYAISFIIGAILLNFYNNNYLFLSPYFIVLMLWYPAYENLFSIIRKTILKRKASRPDNDHLHQLVYFQIKKNFKKFSNTISGLILLFPNIISFYIAYNFKSKTDVLIFLIVINITIYNLAYLFLYKKKYK